MATSARIDELRKKFEENPRRYFAPLANEYRKAGDPERAIAICEEYLPQQPGHMSGHIVYGQALFELGRHDDARQVFETALSLDPENLIALRHLGDIARTAGDHHAARVWYQRVLEADPRNEEIAQLMMSLLSTPIGSDVVQGATATPLSSPAVPRPSSPTPVAAVEEPIDEPELPTTDEMEAPRATAASYTPFPPPPVSPQSYVSRHAPKEEELLDLDSFDLGGVPLSSLRSAKSAEPEPAPEATEPAADRDDDEVFAEFDEQLTASATPDQALADARSVADSDTGIEKAQEFAEGFEPDSLAIAAKPLTEGEVGSFEEAPPGTIELAADVGLGLPDDGGSSSTFTSEEESPVDGLESFEPGFIVGGASTGSEQSLATESFFDSPDSVDEPSADALLDTFVEDSDALAGASAFSQIRDETTEPLIVEPSAESPFTSSPTPFPPFPEAPASPSSTPQFHEALPASSQGDPLLSSVFAPTSTPVESATDETLPESDHETALFSEENTLAAFDDGDAFATSDTAEADAHVPVAETSDTEPGAFVTETMATLYLEQGHYDAALDIYRQLVQQRPDDIPLRDRLHAAEARAWGHQRDLGASILDGDAASVAAFGEDEGDVVPQPHSYGGPTIREFLTGLLYRRSMATVEEMPLSPAPEEMHSEAESESQAHEDAAAMAELPPTPSLVRNTPASSPGDSLTTSLGALFSEADAATSSANPVEGGGLEGRVATPIGGTPAHRAPTELSLDHVFKSNAPRTPSKESFSFDQFFSDEAAEQSTPSAEPAQEPRADTGDDIAQFNAWLNGLKKS